MLYLEARGVRKVCFGALGMVQRSVPNGSVRRADGQTTHVELATRTVTILSSFIHNL